MVLQISPSGCWCRQDDDALFEVEFATMMLQGICLKVEFVEFVIQIQKKAAGLASEAEARRREAWGGAGGEPRYGSFPTRFRVPPL